MIISVESNQALASSHPNSYTIKLGPPKIRFGRLYTVQVCGTNGVGPGTWSKPSVFRFQNGPPNRPRALTISAYSSTSVSVVVSRLPEREENGSPIYN